MYPGSMRKLLACLLLTLLATPAFAGATDWQELAPGVRARLISADAIDPADGRLHAGFELDMPASTKTYWRIPGEAGIPTEFDFSASTGLGPAAIIWPYPQIDRTDGFRDYVYRGHLVIPIDFTPAAGTAATLAVNTMLGICSDICVPAQASFSLPISFGAADPGQASRLQIALGQTPDIWPAGPAPFGAITANAYGIEIADLDPGIDPASVIADLGDPAILFAAPQKSPDGRRWSLKLLGDTGAQGLVGRTVQLTFLARSIPYAVSREIAAE